MISILYDVLLVCAESPIFYLEKYSVLLFNSSLVTPKSVYNSINSVAKLKFS